MNARLPGHRYENTIGSMAIGESAYTVPWAMWADMDGNLWINGNYSLHKGPFGTVSMKVTRDTEGYLVDATRGHAREHKWVPSEQGSAQFVGGADVLPVVEFIG